MPLSQVLNRGLGVSISSSLDHYFLASYWVGTLTIQVKRLQEFGLVARATVNLRSFIHTRTRTCLAALGKRQQSVNSG